MVIGRELGFSLALLHAIWSAHGMLGYSAKQVEESLLKEVSDTNHIHGTSDINTR